MHDLLKEIRSCVLCAKELPNPPNPVLNFTKNSRIMIIGQAPGTKAHLSTKPWNDPSGIRLRSWLGVSDEDFYNPELFALVPMGFCYPGRGKSGDLAPRPECSQRWMNQILSELTHIKLKLIIGSYSHAFFLKNLDKLNLTQRVQNWREYGPGLFPLPHPSPRNNLWLRKNPWFESEIVPALKKKVTQILK